MLRISRRGTSTGGGGSGRQGMGEGNCQGRDGEMLSGMGEGD